MDETEEVYSPEFSLEHLTELVEISPRALSSVLNNHLGTTFRDLLNQYRVRRACRLLSDIENYGYLTIEAIANNVGYKSRTSLTTAFKKEIGMAPSEYQRIARRSSSHPTAYPPSAIFNGLNNQAQRLRQPLVPITLKIYRSIGE